LFDIGHPDLRKNKYVKKAKRCIVYSMLLLIVAALEISVLSRVTMQNKFANVLVNILFLFLLGLAAFSLLYSIALMGKVKETLMADKENYYLPPKEYTLKNADMLLFRNEMKTALKRKRYYLQVDNLILDNFVLDYYRGIMKRTSGIAYIEQTNETAENKPYMEAIAPVRKYLMDMEKNVGTVIYCFILNKVEQELYEELFVPWGRTTHSLEIPLFFDLTAKKVYFPVQKYDLFSEELLLSIVKEFMVIFPVFFEEQ